MTDVGHISCKGTGVSVSWFPVPEESELPENLRGLFRKARERNAPVFSSGSHYSGQEKGDPANFARRGNLHAEEGSLRMSKDEGSKFVLYRDIGDGYRWRLRGPDGETLAESAHGHEEKAPCEEEMRAAMAAHPGVKVLDTTITGGSG